MNTFRDSEDVTIIPLKECEKDAYIIEHLQEERSIYDNWFIDYFIYEDKVTAIETMGENYNHCTAIADTLEEVLEITSKWC